MVDNYYTPEIARMPEIGHIRGSMPASRPQRGCTLLLALALMPCWVFGRIGVSLQMQLGNPSGATANASDHGHYLIQRAQYAMDYSDNEHEPNWVSWDLTSDDLGSSGRSSSFYVDTTLPAGFMQVLTTGYSGSGYDRGHMCPSGDRTITVADNDVTFYMSNMVPQAPDNNQGVWASFENYCRSLATAGNELLITCGPSDFSGATIASGVMIPGAVWKVVVVVPTGSGSVLSRISTATRVIAIKIPNSAGVRSDPWQKYLTSPAQIENALGYTFFTALPPAVSNYLRMEVDGQPAPMAPAITTSPASQVAAAGAVVTLAPVITGSAPLTYQWRKDGVAVSTSPVLSFASVTPAAAGTYELTATNLLGSATTVPAVLTVTQPFAGWVSAKALTGPDALATADPDGDGMPNLVEYALGGDPVKGDAAQRLTFTDTAAHLSLSFARMQSAPVYTVEASDDLVTWMTLATNPGGVGQTVNVTDTVDLAVQPQRFMRLKVTLP